MTWTIKPFPNLGSAGAELAAKLSGFSLGDDLVVLGIVSAGVPAACEIAKQLAAPLDLIIIRRLLTPQGPGSQAVAVNAAGNLVVDEEIGPRPEDPQTPLEYFIADALDGLAQRTKLCRGQRPALDLAGKTVLIVDCAIRSGLTMKAATGAVRKLNPKRIVAAVPVTSQDGGKDVEGGVDQLIYLDAPEPFGNAGVWYKDFSRPADDEMSKFL